MKINLNETDHASTLLGLFASKNLAAKRVAFTLAEILITLGIIGVVAAFTLPILIKNYQMKSFEVAFKKQYSVLNNAINYIQLNNNLSECYITLDYLPNSNGKPVLQYVGRTPDCSELKKELISNLKLQEISKYSKYASREKVKEGGILVNPTVSYDAVVQAVSAFLLPDGSVILMFVGDHDVYTNYTNVVIIIDVNGQKGPNRWGYDAFWLNLVSKNGVLRLSDEYASLAEKGGKLPRTILMNFKDNSDTGWFWGNSR